MEHIKGKLDKLLDKLDSSSKILDGISQSSKLMMEKILCEWYTIHTNSVIYDSNDNRIVKILNMNINNL